MHSAQLGATISSTIEQGVTHVVAGSSGTEKAIQGHRQGLPVVSVDWLVASGRRLAAVYTLHREGCPSKALRLPTDQHCLEPLSSLAPARVLLAGYCGGLLFQAGCLCCFEVWMTTS